MASITINDVGPRDGLQNRSRRTRLPLISLPAHGRTVYMALQRLLLQLKVLLTARLLLRSSKRQLFMPRSNPGNEHSMHHELVELVR